MRQIRAVAAPVAATETAGQATSAGSPATKVPRTVSEQHDVGDGARAQRPEVCRAVLSVESGVLARLYQEHESSL